MGFNVQQLHEHLLKFHYHKNGGILRANKDFSNYARVLLTKLDHTLLPWEHASTLSWICWLRHVLGHVVDIIKIYLSHYLVGYLIEDKNRVTFLAFEFVLRHLDALTLPVIENWDKTLLLELRMFFVTYHTNITYETGIRTLFPSDQQLSTFAFDRSPDSLQSSTHDSQKGASVSSSSLSPSSSSRTSSKTVAHDEYLRQLQMMRSEIDSLKAAMHDQTVDLTLAQQLAHRFPLPSSSHTLMERSLSVAYQELRSVGFEASLDDCPTLLTPSPSVPVSYRTTEAVSPQVSTAVPTVIPPPITGIPNYSLWHHRQSHL